MRGKTLLLTCVLGTAGLQTCSAGALYLSGWAEFGGVSRALITELPENRTWIIRSDVEVAGFNLEHLEISRAVRACDTEPRCWSLKSPPAPTPPTAVEFPANRRPASDYLGPWPTGYEPAFIRLHRQGQLDFSSQ